MPAAFFDFDETVVKEKSMFAFLQFYCRALPNSGLAWEKIMAEIRSQRDHGHSRVEINQYYYGLFAGQSQQQLRDIAVDFVDRGGLTLKQPVVEVLCRHRRVGDTVVFVSGSMRDIIDPMMQRLGVTEALCAEPEVLAGRYTGRLIKRAIGADKGLRLLEFCATHGLSPANCVAYGDDISDADMLAAVGRGVVVDPVPELLALADVKGWTIIDTSKGFVT